MVVRVRETQATQGVEAGALAHDDVLRRDFTASAPNELWLCDLLEHRTPEGKLYVAAIEMAVARRDGHVVGCTFEYHCRSQFRAGKFQRVLAKQAVVGSMGQVGSAGDNAATESFFALMQRNVSNRRA